MRIIPVFSVLALGLAGPAPAAELARAALVLRSSLAEGRMAMAEMPQSFAKVQADELADLLRSSSEDLSKPGKLACEPTRLRLHELTVAVARAFEKIAGGEAQAARLDAVEQALKEVPPCAG